MTLRLDPEMPKPASSTLARPQFPDGAADIARRFGVSIKALRLYEEIGLLNPVRDARGWRSYGLAECTRLLQITTLRELGLPLAQIGELLGTGGQELEAVLDLHERTLVEQRLKVNAALALVRQVKAGIARGEAATVDQLAGIVRQSRAGRIDWTDRIGDLAETVFSPDQQRRLQDSITAESELDWAEFYDALAVVAAKGEPESAEALALGRRGLMLIKRMTGNDPALWRASESFWSKGLADADTAASLPITPEAWAFFRSVVGALRRPSSEGD